jgi:hypothetical protein
MNKKKYSVLPDSLVGVVAGIITIIIFLTGIYSLPSFLNSNSDISIHTLSESPRQVMSYGLFFISQASYILTLFLTTRFFYQRFCRLLRISTLEGYTFIFILILFVGWTVSFIFAEAFFGPPSGWSASAKNPKSIADSLTKPIVFLIISFISNFLTIITAISESSDT